MDTPTATAPKPITERELAVVLHALMKNSGWARVAGGGTMAEDNAPAILLDTEIGQSFIIEVREV